MLVLAALEHQAVIAYALIEQGPSSVGHEVKIIDVEAASRRSAELKTTIQIENETFEIGVGHVLVVSIINQFNVRLHTDATRDSSRYVFRSVGFKPYSDNNPCLLETRSRNDHS